MQRQNKTNMKFHEVINILQSDDKQAITAMLNENAVFATYNNGLVTPEDKHFIHTGKFLKFGNKENLFDLIYDASDGTLVYQPFEYGDKGNLEIMQRITDNPQVPIMGLLCSPKSKKSAFLKLFVNEPIEGGCTIVRYKTCSVIDEQKGTINEVEYTEQNTTIKVICTNGREICFNRLYDKHIFSTKKLLNGGFVVEEFP